MIRQRHYPPDNPDDFDSLCMQLMGKLWDTPNIAKNGRRGHAQDGVDFFGTGQRGVYGGQSKLREPSSPLTKNEVLEEIEKAKRFKPPLHRYAILTSTKRNPSLQSLVANTTSEHLAIGLFSVEICFWDDIEELLETYTDVRDAVFGGLPAEATARIERRLDAIDEGVQHLATAACHEPGDFHQDIDAAVKCTQDGQPDAALGILRLLREHKWGSLSDRHKYRVLANIGHALAAKEDYQEAAKYFTKAKSLQPNDIKARCLEALGLYNLGQRDLAFTLIDDVRRDDPDLPLAAAVWIQSAPDGMSFSEIAAQVSETLYNDGEVAMSLAVRAKRAGDLDQAEHYARVAVAGMPHAWRIHEELAAILLLRELRRARYRFGPRPQLADQQSFEEIVGLLDRSLQLAPTALSPRSLARLHLNTALAQEFLGQEAEVARQTELALAACPTDTDVVLKHSLLLHKQGRTNPAIEELQVAAAREPTVPVVLLLAQFLAERATGNDRKDAISLLHTHIAKIEEARDRVQTDYVELLIELLCRNDRHKEAKQLIDTLDRALLPECGRALLRILVLRESSDRPAAIEQARRLLPEITAKGHWVDRRRLAVLCQYPSHHPIAAAMIGNHCGASIVIGAHPFQHRTATIRQIQSKFVRRLQDCIYYIEDTHPMGTMSREEIRFLADIAALPLSTTVSRYQKLNVSRRRGNAMRQSLVAAGIIEAVTIATRSGQVVLYQLTDLGRTVCSSVGIDPGLRPRASLEHSYWVTKAAEHFEKKGFTVTREHVIKGNGAVDLLAERPGQRIAIEVETGKSDIQANLTKVREGGFDRVVLVATSPAAMDACVRASAAIAAGPSPTAELLTWLDIS